MQGFRDCVCSVYVSCNFFQALQSPELQVQFDLRRLLEELEARRYRHVNIRESRNAWNRIFAMCCSHFHSAIISGSTACLRTSQVANYHRPFFRSTGSRAELLCSSSRSTLGGLDVTTFAAACLTCSIQRCERQLAMEMRSTLSLLARRQLQPARKQMCARMRDAPIHVNADILEKS